jgi:putative MFS transporter
MNQSFKKKHFNIIVLVASLGYFVDIYDLILFGIVKNPSLIDLGITSKEALFSQGNFLLSMQMAGMLIGGIIWGIMGDKRGRLSTLFFTILLYSLANIANGFVQNIEQYAVLRFISGFGLAGELGVGITLVSEVMSKESRGIAASIVSGIGIAGSALAFLVAEQFQWRVAYWAGGGLGLLLLFLRIAVYESGMYEKTKSNKTVRKGDFFSLFSNIRRFRKFLFCILLAIPTWYTVSVLTINAPSFAQDALNISGEVKGSTSVMLHYIGASIGSFLFGFISLKLGSRKKTIFIAIAGIAILTAVYFSLFNATSTMFYTVLLLLGIPMGGLWAIFITTASELFGTNLRATVTTSAPNFVRGATILITFLLASFTPLTGLWLSGIIVGIIFISLAFMATYFIEETHDKELDYIEK